MKLILDKAVSNGGEVSTIVYKHDNKYFDPVVDGYLIDKLKIELSKTFNGKAKLDKVTNGYWYRERNRWHFVNGEVEFTIKRGDYEEGR